MQLLKIAVIETASILGLKPTGVEHLPDSLKSANLLGQACAEYAGRIESPPYDPIRDNATLLLNPKAIHNYSLRLADAVTSILKKNKFPLVLGGDCSIVLGNLLALRCLGKYGLFFVDGHADFYQPEASPKGEVADMDLAIVSGRGPENLSRISMVLNRWSKTETLCCLGIGTRKSMVAGYGSQDVRETDISVLDCAEVRKLGIVNDVSQLLTNYARKTLKVFGFI